MRKRKIFHIGLSITLLAVFAVTMIGISPNTASASAFGIGDTVEVYNTGSSGLLVLSSACGSTIGGKFDGARGVVLDGPVYCYSYNRWLVRWSDGLQGWSAEDWLRKVTQVTTPLDLTVTSVNFSPSSANIDQALTVNFTVANQGSSPSGSFSNRISLGTTQWGTTTCSLGNYSMGSLAAGASQSMTVTTNPIPSSVSCPGSYYVTVFTDGFQQIAESNENNNIGSSTPSMVSVSCPAPTQYNLNINTTGQGTTNPGVGTYTYNQGSQVTVTASPASGWNFSSWGGDASGTGTSTTIIMNSNKNITAYFSQEAPTQYNLNINTTGQGTTNPGVGTYTYNQGSQVTVTASPTSGWNFSSWGGDASGTGTSTTIIMNSNKNITAYFTGEDTNILYQLPATSGRISWFSSEESSSPGAWGEWLGESRGTDEATRYWYCAMRWPYVKASTQAELYEAKNWWHNKKIIVTNPQNGRQVILLVKDWGPAEWTGRVIDVSKPALDQLVAITDSIVNIEFAPQDAALGPVQKRDTISPNASASCFDGQICYPTKEEAVTHVPTHVEPKECFIWNDGPSGTTWRVIPGTGCAHWVAHQLNIRGGATCYDGYSIRVRDVIYGLTEVQIQYCKAGDIWTNSECTHCGIVRQVANGKALVENCSSGEGGVVQSWISSGRYWTQQGVPQATGQQTQQNQPAQLEETVPQQAPQSLIEKMQDIIDKIINLLGFM